MFKKIIKILREIKNYVDGDFAYKQYVAHHKKYHAQKAILNKKDFLKQRQKDKFDGINRCC
ncbi:MAG TPA: YbdD/YjiX family protein [Rickettsiales bacterium]|nr:YbdD/YjiX family protein [Rickettsiales bacterium]